MERGGGSCVRGLIGVTLSLLQSPRGAGYIFGEDVVDKFLHLNKLDHMSRAHQLCMDGFQVLFREQFSTVWSAPNYCHRFGNLAAIMAVDDHLDVRFPAPLLLLIADYRMSRTDDDVRCLQRSYKTFKEAASSRTIGVLENKGMSSDVIDAGYFT
jgi:hypothetical protein